MNGEPIAMLILPYIDPMQYPHIKKTLEEHGAVIKKHENQFHLYFPKGTIKEDRFPMVGVPRQKITFPDGWWLIHEEGDLGRLPVIVIDPPTEEEKPA
jgi:hypothetical protein